MTLGSEIGQEEAVNKCVEL